ncbi:MAG: hypothetical protein ABW194_00310, partial [Novosphingobium sp.]
WARLMALDSAWHDAADDLASSDPWTAEQHYTEFAGFMPDVQRFLYGDEGSATDAGGYGASPIHVFRRSDVVRAEVTLRAGDPVIPFEVARVELYFFYDIDLAILAVEIVGRDLTLAQAQETLFRFGRAYPGAWQDDGRAVHCCDVTLFDEHGREVAASDHGCKQRYLASVVEHRAPHIAAHWAYLLDPLVPQHAAARDTIPYRQVEPEQMAFLAYLAVDEPQRISRADWLRLGLGAPPGLPGHSPFGSGYLDDFEQRCCYDRHWAPDRSDALTRSRMICSGHVFVMVGDVASANFVDEARGALAKFRHQYFLLGLIAHFHRASLLVFRDRLVSAMSLLHDYAPETLKRFRREIRLTQENFLRFTHRYWFHDVSHQGPASDLFDRWVAQLGTDRLFAEVREEVNDMIDYLDSDGLRRQANSVVRLTVVTFFGLIGTVATGLLGMNLIDLTQEHWLVRLLVLIAVLIPVAALTFYTAAKSQRLSEFLEAVSDARLSPRDKLRALARVWRRG